MELQHGEEPGHGRQVTALLRIRDGGVEQALEVVSPTV